MPFDYAQLEKQFDLNITKEKIYHIILFERNPLMDFLVNGGDKIVLKR